MVDYVIVPTMKFGHGTVLCDLFPNGVVTFFQAAISRRLSDVHDNLSSDVKSESPVGKEKLNGAAPVITIHEKKWTDGSVSLDMVSPSLAKLGKRRRIASVADAKALEEVIATESVVRNLSMFSELRSIAKPEIPLPTIDRFLYIYDELLKSTESISGNSISQSTITSNHSSDQSRYNSSLWVEATLVTNLEVVSLLTNEKLEASFSKPESIPKKRVPSNTTTQCIFILSQHSV